MASIWVILCSLLGLVVGLIGWLGFGMSPVVALGIWVAAGPIAAALAILFSSPVVEKYPSGTAKRDQPACESECDQTA